MKPILSAFLNGLKRLKNALETRFSTAFRARLTRATSQTMVFILQSGVDVVIFEF
jgi:hypothetical protein